MNNEKILKDIDELIMTNRVARQFAGTEMAKDSLRKSNDVLSKARIALKNKDGGYEKGLKDAWNLAFKISGSPDKGCYNNDELYEIFDCRSSCGVFDSYSYNTALRLVEEYEKKKDEAAKLVPGDVVDVLGVYDAKNKYHGIFIKYNDNDDVVILTRSYGSTTFINSDNSWEITKTGEHIDISELIGVLYEQRNQDIFP